jgi:thiamine kinase-like enzyme
LATIDDVVARIPEWQGSSIRTAPLTGGLTNINYRVEVDGMPFVVRVPGEKTELLSINRVHEYHNTLAAAQAGVGARIVHYIPELSVMVLEFIQGPTMSGELLRGPGMRSRIADSVRRLHAGPPFVNEFNMFRTMDTYLGIVRSHGMKVPDGYADYISVAARIEEALGARPVPLVPCNNDLMAENFIDDGKMLRLVDYEYSGNNDPCFELGHICNEAEFGPELVDDLCFAYFGHREPATVARIWLWYCMANLGWTLWGAIQHAVSEIEFDFWDWTLTRWNRVLAKVESPEFGRWLMEVRRPDGLLTH